MKGLLIKDFKLLKVQKNSFLLILCIAIGMEIFTNSTSSSFIIGYLSFVATLFTLSSISYDEFDNGNAFLFSLPITRKSYVIEKYGFGMIMGSSFWAFGTLIVILKEIIAMKYVSIDTIMAAFIILPIVFSVLAIMLPFQLKFGGEKGRIAIICTLVIVFLMGIVITKVSNAYLICQFRAYVCIVFSLHILLHRCNSTVNRNTCKTLYLSFCSLGVLRYQFSRLNDIF